MRRCSAVGAVTASDEVARMSDCASSIFDRCASRPVHRVEHASYEILGTPCEKGRSSSLRISFAAGAIAPVVAQTFRAQHEVESLFEGMTLHTAEAFGEPLRVAVITTGGYLRAARDRVPGAISPLDRRVECHSSPEHFTNILPESDAAMQGQPQILPRSARMASVPTIAGAGHGHWRGTMRSAAIETIAVNCRWSARSASTPQLALQSASLRSKATTV